MNPLVKRTGHHPIGRDQVDAFEARHSRKEVPVRRQQAVSVECMIAHRKHHVAPRPRRGFSDERRPQSVLVVAAGPLDEMLEMPERRDQKPRLANEALRAPIVRSGRLKRPHGKPLKGVDVLQVVSQRVVEPDDLRHKPGPQAKRRFLAFVDSDAAGDPGQNLPLRVGEPRRSRRKALAQPLDELARGHDVRKDQRIVCRKPAIFDGLKQISRRRPGGHDDEAIARGERRSVAGEVHQRLAERMEVRRSHEPGRARRDHCNFGGSSSSRISCWTRDNSNSAPAADDEASHAALTLAARAAP